MSMRSIYHKTCPSCAALVESDTTRCECGYSFDEARKTDSVTEDMSEQEQELFREYLNARISQAVEELQSIQSTLAADPKNLQKADRLMKAYVTLNELRQELGTPAAERHESGGPAGEPAAATTAVDGANDPTHAFREAQARKAEQIMKAAGMDIKECPKCQAVIPERAVLCFCGYAFTRAGAETPMLAAKTGNEQQQKNI